MMNKTLNNNIYKISLLLLYLNKNINYIFLNILTRKEKFTREGNSSFYVYLKTKLTLFYIRLTS